jgi:hypothetical protein
MNGAKGLRRLASSLKWNHRPGDRRRCGRALREEATRRARELLSARRRAEVVGRPVVAEVWRTGSLTAIRSWGTHP